MTKVLLKSDFDIVKKIKTGNGGTSYIINNDHDLYVYKPYDFVQGINEYVAQRFIKSMGLNFMAVQWMKYGDLISCVTKSKNDLTRIYSDYFNKLDEDRKIEWFIFRILNRIFDNHDKHGEQYLDKDSNLYSLDFGESIISGTQNVRMILKNVFVDNYRETIIDEYCDKKFYRRLTECRHECYELLNKSGLTTNNIDDYFEKALVIIKSAKINDMGDVFDDISCLFSKELANIYREILEIVIKLCNFKR
jgi:hypothetical protein